MYVRMVGGTVVHTNITLLYVEQIRNFIFPIYVRSGLFSLTK